MSSARRTKLRNEALLDFAAGCYPDSFTVRDVTITISCFSERTIRTGLKQLADEGKLDRKWPTIYSLNAPQGRIAQFTYIMECSEAIVDPVRTVAAGECDEGQIE